METKKRDLVSIVRDKIIYSSIESLKRDGLKFSVDVLAEKLGVSKKTIYKYFPTKEALALAIYERYYLDVGKRSEGCGLNELLYLYYCSKKMIRSEIFNKYKLNEVIYSYASERNDELWEKILQVFRENCADKNLGNKSTRIIVDGAFEKLCGEKDADDGLIKNVIEGLVKIIC